jgi:uncharacterized protein YjbJ (UPF0337 family)
MVMNAVTVDWQMIEQDHQFRPMERTTIPARQDRLCRQRVLLSSVIPAGRITFNGSEIKMDKDRIIGSAKQVKGTVKEVTGRILGDSKLATEGKLDILEGKTQNALGGLRDTLNE